MGLLPLLLVGCVIPPSLSVDTTDAGVNSPPAIISVRDQGQELVEPGPLDINLGTSDSLNLTLLDTDVGDALYVRIFVDYNLPDATAPRSTCSTGAGSTAQRSATCTLMGLCLSEDVGQTRNMTIVVFDRPVLDSGTPLFQAMAPGGQSTSRYYMLKCQPAS